MLAGAPDRGRGAPPGLHQFDAALESAPVTRDAMATEAHFKSFEPSLRQRRAGAELVLGHAPIEAAALANRDAVCTLNPGLARGTADRLGGAEVQALVPFPRRVGAASSCRRIPETPPPDPKARVGTADISGRGDGGGSS